MSFFIVNDVERSQWSSFINQHPLGNIFQTYEMFDIYKKTEKFEPIFIAVLDDKNEIAGSLLAVIQKEHSGFKGIFSARTIVWGGPLIKNNNTEILDYILKEFKRRVMGKSIYSQFRNLWNWNADAKGIFSKNGFIFEDHLDIIIDLNKTEEQLWSNFSRDRKKSIKKSETFLHVEELNMEKNFDAIYSLIKKVYNRIKLPLPSSVFFYNSMTILNKNYLKAFGAYKESSLVGVRLVLCYKSMIYDWYAAADDNYLEYRPNDILPWSAIKWGVINKYEVFDFGGAGKPNIPYGVREYKLKFGGNLVNYGRFELIHKPGLYRFGKYSLQFYKRIHGLFKF